MNIDFPGVARACGYKEARWSSPVQTQQVHGVPGPLTGHVGLCCTKAQGKGAKREKEGGLKTQTGVSKLRVSVLGFENESQREPKCFCGPSLKTPRPHVHLRVRGHASTRGPRSARSPTEAQGEFGGCWGEGSASEGWVARLLVCTPVRV